MKKTISNIYHSLLFSFCYLLASPAFADLDELEEKSTGLFDGITGLVISVSLGVFTLAVMVTGILCFFGRFPKEKFFHVIGGGALIAAAPIITAIIFEAFK